MRRVAAKQQYVAKAADQVQEMSATL